MITFPVIIAFLPSWATELLVAAALIGAFFLGWFARQEMSKEQLKRLSRGVKVPPEWRKKKIDAPLDGVALTRPEMANAGLVIRTLSGHGTGVCISSSGLVLTNAHVVEDEVVVEVEDEGMSYLGIVVKVCKKKDVAVVVIGDHKVPPVKISGELPQVGDPVYVSGTPSDPDNRAILTHGMLAKKGAGSGVTLEDGKECKLKEVLYLDAHIDRGNSGGPVFNERGELIGISMAVVPNSDGGVGYIGVAIPISEALERMEITSGKT